MTQPLLSHHLPFTPPPLREYHTTDPVPGAQVFRILPISAISSRSRAGWRIVLLRPGQRDPMALDLRGEVTLGLLAECCPSDLNFTHWDASAYGVSRLHARLLPRQNSLYVMDLRSTNGSYVNGLPLRAMETYPLANGDILSLGRLHVHVRIVAGPA